MIVLNLIGESGPRALPAESFVVLPEGEITLYRDGRQVGTVAAGTWSYVLKES